jgi:site-specific DNA recombinase
LENQVEIIKGHGLIGRKNRGVELQRLRVAAYCRVSTNSEDQLNSYKSQVQHYTDYIKEKVEWVFAGIYADEAITGTQTRNREEFQRLINDCMNGDIDMVITKSISRFARNTLDTLRYVRMLKEKDIAVFFEEENINTLTMDGELLLVILSSVAQQEVENISANVKKGLRMKMQRGELVGFQGCLGYDYHPEDKSLTINKEESKIVQYIFQRYAEGAGSTMISKELHNLGYMTKRGLTNWPSSTIIGIISNEKYRGDVLLGKTFTVDPISKRRLENFGEEDKYYIKGHHEPIITEEVFDKAQEILKRRGHPRRLNPEGKREKYSRKYAFSSLLECGFCGTNLNRRSWHASSQYKKIIWQCTAATKKGKKHCPQSKGIEENTIENAFLEAYKFLFGNDKEIVNEFLRLTEETLSEDNVDKNISKTERSLSAFESKKNKLIDLRLESTIDKETFASKLFELESNIDILRTTLKDLAETKHSKDDLKKRIDDFRKTLESNQVLEKFDRFVFESIIEKVIIGGLNDEDVPEPGLITFIFKTGIEKKVNKNQFASGRRKLMSECSDEDLCTFPKYESGTLSTNRSLNTR